MSDVRTLADDRHSAKSGGERSGRPRSLRYLTAAALTVSLLLGGAFVAVDRLHSTPADAVEHPENPMSDDQSATQAIESAKEVVTVAGLHTLSAGYTLMSCKNRDDPPYQGAVYLTFALPATARPEAYFPAIPATLATHGWAEGIPPNNQPFGRIASKDGVTVMVYRESADSGVGVMRVYGQCRNANDHRTNSTSWTDVTDQFPRTH